jgi:diaminohydroxyphosphoribosylaminopyrimidine deaminase/5-amino-6-(5-phosphoribosylamino)uracil reductase
MSFHQDFMQEALYLAARGRGYVSPNPMVGALVVKASRVVGRGYHGRFGERHAEVVALGEAGPKARGGTLYVTLEPCAHAGKTPPCVDAIRAAGIRTVILGARDPNPKAAGGVQALQAFGIKVVTGVLEEACRAQNAAFFKFVRTGLPLVSAKWAMTADGKIATARGDSRWITAAKARAYSHDLRGSHDSVLVGIGTVLTDAPLLTARLGLAAPDGSTWQPRRVILDSRARTPVRAPLWSAENGGPILVFVSDELAEDRVKPLKDKGAEVIRLPAPAGRLPVPAVLQALSQRGVLSVLVEGGAEVLGSFLDARVVDRVYVFVAPKIIGGRDGVTAVRGGGVDRVSQSQEVRVTGVRQFDQDLLIEGRLGDWSWFDPAGGPGERGAAAKG